MARGQMAAVPPPPKAEPEIDALEKFSRELAIRYPDRFIKRFVLPSNVREAREVFMMEIDAKDEIAAAAMADATMSKQERESKKLAEDAERREAIKIAIVGLGKLRGGKAATMASPVDYMHTNSDGVPFTEPNTWTTKAWSCLYTYNGQMNGVPTDELYQGIAEARTVGAFAPPMPVTPESNSPEK